MPITSTAANNATGVGQLIKFYSGTQQEFDILNGSNQLNDSYLYFITDTKRIYKGGTNISDDVLMVDEFPGGSLDTYEGKILIKRTPRVGLSGQYDYVAYTVDLDNTQNQWQSIITPLTNAQILSQLEQNVVTNPVTGSGTTPARTFTEAERTKLKSIAQGAEVNVQADWAESNTNLDNYIRNKPSIVNDLNSSVSNVNGVIPSVSAVKNELSSYVNGPDKLKTYYLQVTEWKPFTNELNTKLNNIEKNANNYSLPTATSSVLGGIKIGTDLLISGGVVNLATQSITAGNYGPTSDITVSPSSPLSIPMVTFNNKGILTGIQNRSVKFDPIGSVTTGSPEGTDYIALKKTNGSIVRVTMQQIAEYCQTYSPGEGQALLTESRLSTNGGDLVQYGLAPSSTVTNRNITGNLIGNVKGTSDYATNLGTSGNSYNKSSLDTALNNKQPLHAGLTQIANMLANTTPGYIRKVSANVVEILNEAYFTESEVTNKLKLKVDTSTMNAELAKKANLAGGNTFTGSDTYNNSNKISFT